MQRPLSPLKVACSSVLAAGAAFWLALGVLAPLGFGSSSEPVRILSCWFVEECHSFLPFGRQALIRGLAAADPLVREAMASEIGASRIRPARRELVRAFASEPDREARSAMIGAIVDLGEKDVVPLLVPLALRSSEAPEPERVPGAARWALAELTADPALAMFRGGLGGLHSPLRPCRSLSETKQIRIVRDWWKTHRYQYEGAGH